MADNILKSLPTNEIERKKAEARLALQGVELPNFAKAKDAMENIRKIKNTGEIEARSVDILSSLSNKELSLKKLEAKEALGDIPRKKIPRSKELRLQREIKELEKVAIQRGLEYSNNVPKSLKNISANNSENHAEKLHITNLPQFEIEKEIQEEEKKEPEKKIESLKPRDFNADLKKVLTSKDVSLAKLAIIEQERRLSKQGTNNRSSFASKRAQNMVVLISTIFVIFGGLVVTYYAFLRVDIRPPQTIVSREYILTPDSDEKISTTQDLKISDIFRNSIQNSSIENGKIHGLSITAGNTLLTSEDILSGLFENAPDRLVRSLGNDYMIGILNDLGNRAFVIFDIASFETAFDSMLSWETTSLIETAHTMRGEQTRYRLRDVIWKDGTFSNVSVRLAQTGEGKIVLLYAFLNKGTLLITGDQGALKILIKRFASPKKVLQ